MVCRGVDGRGRNKAGYKERKKTKEFRFQNRDVVPDKELEELQSKCFISIQHAQNYVLVIEKTLQLNVIGSLWKILSYNKEIWWANRVLIVKLSSVRNPKLPIKQNSLYQYLVERKKFSDYVPHSRVLLPCWFKKKKKNPFTFCFILSQKRK